MMFFFMLNQKNKREYAQYSTKINFQSKEVELMKLKTTLFVNITKEILKSNGL